ncbi:hypothetical protein NUW54_g7337 [Trametes sanguinea]|uniref:Uncharacterized protein n=1 Tax=Trametes sanguinea TaxID=158606 RepID=A0ACC1PNX0_9APHY|nr:hypothetical protein NUW54_g7337 [Trametes sanguinea]
MDTPVATTLEPVAEPPLKRSRSYVSHLCGEDQDDFRAAKLYIKQVLPRELDVQHSWKKQTRGATDRFLLKILDIFPVFKKYSKAWPLQYYSYQRFAQMRATLRVSGRLPKGCSRTVADIETTPSDPTREPPRERNIRNPGGDVSVIMLQSDSFLAGDSSTPQGDSPSSSTQSHDISHRLVPPTSGKPPSF